MLKWIIAGGGLGLLYLVREQFPAFIVGMVIAYLLSRPVSFLNHRAHLSRGLAVLLIYVVAIAGLGAVIWMGQAVVVEQAGSLFQHREAIVTSLVQQVSAATGWSPNVAAVTTEVLEKVQTFITAQPQELLAVGGILSRSLLFVLISLVSSIYFLRDAGKIGAFCLRFVPEGKRDECSKVAADINGKFGKYIAGQFLLMAIMAVLAFAILCFYHVKYALIVALLAGVLEMIPVFGPMAALALASTIAASQLGLHGALPVAILLWSARLFEDYIVIPKVIGHAVQLHPLVTIFAVLAGETLAGGLGMLLAVPAAAAVNVVVDHFYPQDEIASTGGGNNKSWGQAKAIGADLQKLFQRGVKQASDWIDGLGKK